MTDTAAAAERKAQKNFTLTGDQKTAWGAVRNRFPVVWTDGEVLGYLAHHFLVTGNVPGDRNRISPGALARLVLLEEKGITLDTVITYYSEMLRVYGTLETPEQLRKIRD